MREPCNPPAGDPDLDCSALPPALRLGEPVTDHLHAEFLLLLEQAAQAPDGALLAALDEWLDHTRYHFGQEEAWMEAMGYGPRDCHRTEHEQMLAIAARARGCVEQGDAETGRRLIAELPGWLAQHIGQRDAPMVAHMRENGFTLVEGPVQGQAAP
ncbi:hemerythrin domain-containing protein [Cupriavidus sp. AU9028]|uniref:hemerythrin domain-containing protein n=1 Tax=Cupriavidus sp. AU9028 TaxID=2871157 RepID=UPI001C98336A|nr:hemerythrin domain-containing protein [Cupriavidus sp. AU9028]MBY4898202.1 hemerythrin domain-containing protein [Cupriavidus sp. AU9028]